MSRLARLGQSVENGPVSDIDYLAGLDRRRRGPFVQAFLNY